MRFPLLLFLQATSIITSHHQTQGETTTLCEWRKPTPSSRDVVVLGSQSLAISLRGGASRRKSKKPSSKKTATGKKKLQSAEEEKMTPASSLADMFKAITPLTRIQLSATIALTLLSVAIGEEVSHAILALDPVRTFYALELWRPFSAAAFIGPPSLGWLYSVYYLVQYGSSLEKTYGMADHLVFLLTQVVLLSVCSIVLGMPFFGQSIITAALYAFSRSAPHDKAVWLLFRVDIWMLPYVWILGDVLQSQSLSAALPHLVGILCGHFYYFHRFVWPLMGGEDWLGAPNFLVRRLDADAKETDKRTLKRKRGKGRKLGNKK